MQGGMMQGGAMQGGIMQGCAMPGGMTQGGMMQGGMQGGMMPGGMQCGGTAPNSMMVPGSFIACEYVRTVAERQEHDRSMRLRESQMRAFMGLPF
jgi:hypothetical protein